MMKILWWLTSVKLWDKNPWFLVANTLTTLGCHSPGDIRILNTVDPFPWPRCLTVNTYCDITIVLTKPVYIVCNVTLAAHN